MDINDKLRYIANKGSAADRVQTIGDIFDWVREIVTEIQEDQRTLSERYSTKKSLAHLKNKKISDEEAKKEHEKELQLEQEKMALIRKVEQNIHKKMMVLNKIEGEVLSLLSEIRRAKH